MKKLILIGILIIMTGSVFAETNPYESDLLKYQQKKDFGMLLLTIGVSSTGAGFLTSSTFMTLDGFEMIDPAIAQPVELTSYGVISAGVVTAIIGFFVFKDGVDKYIETLRLQTIYNSCK